MNGATKPNTDFYTPVCSDTSTLESTPEFGSLSLLNSLLSQRMLLFDSPEGVLLCVFSDGLFFRLSLDKLFSLPTVLPQLKVLTPDVNRNLSILTLSALFGTGLLVSENNFPVNGSDGNRPHDLSPVICFSSVVVSIL